MEWTIQRLRRYLGPVKVQVAFQGITDEGLQAALHQEAVQRLALVEAIVFDEETSEHERMEALKEQFLNQRPVSGSGNTRNTKPRSPFGERARPTVKSLTDKAETAIITSEEGATSFPGG